MSIKSQMSEKIMVDSYKELLHNGESDQTHHCDTSWWPNLKIRTLSNRSKSQKNAYSMIPFIQSLKSEKNKNIVFTKKCMDGKSYQEKKGND